MSRYSQVKAIARTALLDPKGVHVTISAARAGSMVAARSAIRGLQMAFSAWRSQERKAARKRYGDSYEHPADALICRSVELPDGWRLEMVRPSLDDGMLVVTSVTNGKEINPATPRTTPSGRRFYADHPKSEEWQAAVIATDPTPEQLALMEEVDRWVNEPVDSGLIDDLKAVTADPHEREKPLGMTADEWNALMNKPGVDVFGDG